MADWLGGLSMALDLGGAMLALRVRQLLGLGLIAVASGTHLPPVGMSRLTCPPEVRKEGGWEATATGDCMTTWSRAAYFCMALRAERPNPRVSRADAWRQEGRQGAKDRESLQLRGP